MSLAHPRTIFLAAGGTGGHIYPALAVARAWGERHPGDRIFFLGRSEGLEAKLIPKEGYQLLPVRSAGVVGKSFFQKLKGGCLLMMGIRDARRHVKLHRPAVAVGFGGFVSFPAVKGAQGAGVPTMILEVNRSFGAANRLLSRTANRVAVAFEENLEGLGSKGVHTGVPVRDFEKCSRDHSRFGILIVGGSQGALQVNSAVCESLVHLKSVKDKIKFFHATGQGKQSAVRDAYLENGFEADVTDYYHDMAHAYAQADLVVARAGAITLAELSKLGKASILIPLPHSAGDHQRDNALALERAGATVLLDSPKGDEGLGLAGAIIPLLNDRSRLEAMQAASLAMARPGATERLLDEIETLINV